MWDEKRTHEFGRKEYKFTARASACAHATHEGEFRGLAPTGKKITWEAVSIWCIADGKVVELQYATTELDFLKELGGIEWKGFPDEATRALWDKKGERTDGTVFYHFAKPL